MSGRRPPVGLEEGSDRAAAQVQAASRASASSD